LIELGDSDNYWEFGTTTNNKYFTKYLTNSLGDADYEHYDQVVSGSGASKNRQSYFYDATGIYNGVRTSIFKGGTVERTTTNHFAYNYDEIAIGSSTARRDAGMYVQADSLNSITSAAFRIRTENSATPRYHWAGLAKGTGSINSPVIVAPNGSQFHVQTQFNTSTTKFDWLRIDNLDTDTTSNRLSFYNNKYSLPNSRPSTTSGVKQSLVWTGTGSAATVAFENIPNIYNSDGTLTGARTIDADFNSLDIVDVDYISITGGANSEIFMDSTEIALYSEENVSIGAGTAEITLDNTNDDVRIKGKVRALREDYNNVTSTTSPVTLSSTIPDNLINQGSTQATFTLNLPASPVDGQICRITYANAISTLTIDGNGETILGSAVTTGVIGSQRAFKYYAAASAWIKLY
jgi:hypothetical protein